MPWWDKVKQELDRAGRVAQEALDEGRIRLEALRERQLADKAAERLGYAVHRARAAGGTAEGEEIDRLYATLAEHEAEATRLDAELAVITRRTPRPADAPEGTAPTGAASTGVATPAHSVDPREGVDFGGNSGASHNVDGTVYTGDAGTGGSTGGSGEAGRAPGAPPQERTEWNREHL